jgi:hypothetical protein
MNANIAHCQRPSSDNRWKLHKGIQERQRSGTGSDSEKNEELKRSTNKTRLEEKEEVPGNRSYKKEDDERSGHRHNALTPSFTRNNRSLFDIRGKENGGSGTKKERRKRAEAADGYRHKVYLYVPHRGQKVCQPGFCAPQLELGHVHISSE